MIDLAHDRLQSLILAFTSTPDMGGWIRCVIILATSSLVSAIIGVLTGFLKRDARKVGGWNGIAISIMLFFRPSLLEEAVFRILLLPRPDLVSLPTQTVVWALISLVIFVLWHPVNGKFFRPEAQKLFTHPIFLILATLLGIACTAAYLTTGSIWPSILIHWLTVVAWILFLGGAEITGLSRLFPARGRASPNDRPRN